MPRPFEPRVLDVTETDRQLLISWVRAGLTPQRVVRRARVVLLAVEGASIRAISERLCISTRTVALWIRRYEDGGPYILWRDAPGRGRKPSISPEVTSRVRALRRTSRPEGGRWSIRRLAELTGVSRASVHRILRSVELS
jgi:transposase